MSKTRRGGKGWSYRVDDVLGCLGITVYEAEVWMIYKNHERVGHRAGNSCVKHKRGLALVWSVCLSMLDALCSATEPLSSFHRWIMGDIWSRYTPS